MGKGRLNITLFFLFINYYYKITKIYNNIYSLCPENFERFPNMANGVTWFLN